MSPEISTDTSRSLLDRLQTANSAEDWDIFCRIYQQYVRRYLLSRKVDEGDVDDVVQEILSRVFKSFPSFAHNGRQGAFRKWLGTIVSQQTWRYFQARDQQPTVSIVSPEQFEDSAIANDEMEARWDSEHDRHVVGRLLELIKPEFTETTWQAFRLVSIKSLPPAEVAARLGVTVNAVVIAKSRVLRRLRIIGKHLIDAF